MGLDSVSIATADTDNDFDKRKQYIQQVGTLSSALEHAVPEQMFVTAENPGEAISAVKALSKAAQAGQRIYQITQANMATVLPNIHHSAETMSEITSALNAGMEVITHTDAVQVPGYSGAGYIILDPVTGDGAYKIESGLNGAWHLILYGILLLVSSLLILLAIFFSPVILAGTTLIAGTIAAMAGFFFGLYAINPNHPDSEQICDVASAAALVSFFTLLGSWMFELGIN